MRNQIPCLNSKLLFAVLFANLIFPLGSVLLPGWLFSGASLYARTGVSQGEYAELIGKGDDYGCGGFIEYRILGNESDYTYYWLHGPTTLRITNLAPGFYTLIVRDKDGCEKHYTTLILDKSGCDVEIVFSEGLTPCDIYVTVIPIDSTAGLEIPNLLYGQITWSDGGPGVFTRLLSKAAVESGSISFTYSQVIDGEVCCEVEGIILPGEDWEGEPEGGCTTDCNYEIQVVDDTLKCHKRITIIPDSVILQGISQSAFVVRWSDGLVSQNLFRTVVVYDSSYTLHASVSIFELFSCSEYCQFTFTVEIEADPRCRRWERPKEEDQILIVNEFGTLPGSPESKYIELLVTGGGNCGEYSDLRGIIIDDNNGQLIPPGEFIHEYNRHLIGISPGFIYFAYHENWEQVPNGSLIVIYDQRDGEDILPPDDPFDMNEDHVYVVPLNDEVLFRAKTGRWDETIKMEEYQGVLDTLCWDKIAVSGNADGIQVRLSSGEYIHGISAGSSHFSAPENHFSLWLGDIQADNVVCRLMGDAPYDNRDFLCAFASVAAASPGMPNSEKNASLSAGLLDCNYEAADLPIDDEPLPPIYDLQITKTANVLTFDSLGQEIIYTIVVTNNGNSILTDVVVIDINTGLDTIIPALLPCESRTFITTYEVDCKTLGNSSGLSNTAMAAFNTPLGNLIQVTDSAHVSNGAIVLHIIKEVSESANVSGDTLRFFLKLSNIGQNGATGISVEDYLPVSGYTGVHNTSHGGQIISSDDSLTVIGWEGLSVPEGEELILFFDAVVVSGGAYRNCAAIVNTDQFNVSAPPCNNDPEKPGISSCVEPAFSSCQLEVVSAVVHYNDNGTPVDPFDDFFHIGLVVTKPPGIPGINWTFNSSVGSFIGPLDQLVLVGPFPIGFAEEWVTITILTEGVPPPCQTLNKAASLPLLRVCWPPTAWAAAS